jgi:hypothetical protein
VICMRVRPLAGIAGAHRHCWRDRSSDGSRQAPARFRRSVCRCRRLAFRFRRLRCYPHRSGAAPRQSGCRAPSQFDPCALCCHTDLRTRPPWSRGIQASRSHSVLSGFLSDLLSRRRGCGFDIRAPRLAGAGSTDAPTFEQTLACCARGRPDGGSADLRGRSAWARLTTWTAPCTRSRRPRHRIAGTGFDSARILSASSRAARPRIEAACNQLRARVTRQAKPPQRSADTSKTAEPARPRHQTSAHRRRAATTSRAATSGTFRLKTSRCRKAATRSASSS